MQSDFAAFQRERPDLPQGPLGTLPESDRKLVALAYVAAIDEAKVKAVRETDPDFADTLERAYRKKTITVVSHHK